MVRSSSDVLGSKTALATSGMATYVTPDQIFWGLRRVLYGKEKLKAYYKEIVAALSSMSGDQVRLALLLKLARDLEMSIPELILPASLAAYVR
jgi:hypothetical protein